MDPQTKFTEGFPGEIRLAFLQKQTHLAQPRNHKAKPRIWSSCTLGLISPETDLTDDLEN